MKDVGWCGMRAVAVSLVALNFALLVYKILVIRCSVRTIHHGHVKRTIVEDATRNGMMKKEITRFAPMRFPAMIFLLAL